MMSFPIVRRITKSIIKNTDIPMSRYKDLEMEENKIKYRKTNDNTNNPINAIIDFI